MEKAKQLDFEEPWNLREKAWILSQLSRYEDELAVLEKLNLCRKRTTAGSWAKRATA